MHKKIRTTKKKDQTVMQVQDPTAATITRQRRLIVKYQRTSTLGRFLALIPKTGHIFRATQNWKLVWGFLAVYTTYWIPLSVSFTSRKYHMQLILFDLFVDLLRLCCFLVALQRKKPQNYREYLKTIGYNLLLIFPYDVFWFLSDRLVWIEHLNLLKVTILVRLHKLIKQTPARIELKTLIRLVQLSVYLGLCLHFMACVWHLLVLTHKFWEPPSNLAFSYYESSSYTQYTFAFYYATGLFVGVEIMPQTLIEQVFGTVALLLGPLVGAWLFGEVSVLLSNLRRESSYFHDITNRVQLILNNLRVPQSLHSKVTDYLLSTRTTLKMQHEYIVLCNSISPSLRTDVKYVLFHGVKVLSLLVYKDPKSIQRIIEQSRNLFYQPDDTLTLQGEPSEFVGFLLTGSAHVFVRDISGQQVQCNLLNDGDYFGELGVIYDRTRTATIKAAKYSIVGAIDKLTFREILGDCPELDEELILRLAQYRDPLTRKLDQQLKKLFYVRNLNESQYFHLLFSITEEAWKQGSVLVDCEQPCSRVYFLLGGYVNAFFSVHGIYTHFVPSNNFESVYQDLYTTGSRSVNNSSTHIRKNGVLLTTISAPATLCAHQALLHAASPVKLVCETECSIFSLDIEKIRAIATVVNGNLKANLLMYTSRFDTKQDIMSYCPALDMQIDKPPLRERVCLIFKQIVLTVIMRRRAERLATKGLKPMARVLIGLSQYNLKTVERQCRLASLCCDELELFGADPTQVPRHVLQDMYAVAQHSVVSSWKLEHCLLDMQQTYSVEDNWSKQFQTNTLMLQYMLDQLSLLTQPN